MSSRLPDPVDPPTGATSAAFSPDATYLAVARHLYAPSLVLYKRKGNTFTRLPDPPVIPAG